MTEKNVYINSSLNSERKITLSSEVFLKACGGDQAAFGEIYDQFFPKIYRFIFYRVSHKEVAEDLAEEVFIKAHAKLASLKNEKTFEGWLYRIARNEVIDYYRQKKSDISLEEIELGYDSNIVDEINVSADQKLLLELIAKLPKEQHTVIKLKFLEELDNQTIAQILSKSEGAIRVIQHRAIIKLQEFFKQEE